MAETRGKYNLTPPTLNNNQFGDFQLDVNGNTKIAVSTTASGLGKVEDAPHTSGDVGVMLLGVRNDSGASSFTDTNGDYSPIAVDSNGIVLISLVGQGIVKEYAAAFYDWNYAPPVGGIVNTTTAVTIKAAAGAGLRNYVTGLIINNDTLGAATELAIRDGAAGTVLFRIKLQTTALGPTQIQFLSPLKGTANTLLEIVTLTASITGGVYANVSGYVGS